MISIIYYANKNFNYTKILRLYIAVLFICLPNKSTAKNLTADSLFVSSSTDLKNAIKSAAPGNIIVVENGTYNPGGLTVACKATQSQPLIITARNIGKAELSGSTYFDLKLCSYVTLQGFNFTGSVSTAVKLEACNHIRITRNIFHLNETTSSKWIYIGGIYNDANAPSQYNRIDHNLFEDKHQLGNFITIDGQEDPVYQISQYDRIDHNYFRRIGPRAVNEMESIRVGVSTLSMSDGFEVIEYNLFEECDGDPEIVSVKSCRDTVRYNTFYRSQGSLSFRSGNGSVAEGNFFLGDGRDSTGGIRMYGNDHIIFNNYFEGLTGTHWDAAISLTNGDYDGGSNLTNHNRIVNAEIVHNTFVNNLHNIEIGFTNNGSYTKPPSNVLIANNLVTGNVNKLVDIMTQPVNMTWSGNIIYPAGSAVTGTSLTEQQAKVIDPELSYEKGSWKLNGDNGLWKLSAGSPAINSAPSIFPFVKEDMDGQTRDRQPDIGADEYFEISSLRFPMDSNTVGPFAYEDSARVEAAGISSQITPDGYVLENNFPNPFNPSTTIKFMLAEAGNVKLTVFNELGKTVRVLLDGQYKPAGTYSLKFNAETGGISLPSGVYFYKLQVNKKFLVKKMMLLK